MKNMKKRIWAVIMGLVLISISTGCGKTEETKDTSKKQDAAEDTGKSAEDIKIAYISKDLTNPWFVLQDEGLKAKAEELGVEYFSIDARFDDEACDAAIDNALAQDIDGLAICITNQGNGPSVAMKCKEKDVALITCDDSILDENNEQVPHVGMPTEEVGYLGGEKLAEYANNMKFFEEGNVVKVLQIDAPDVSVLRPRLDGYKKALMENTPLKEEDFINVETTECMLEDSIAAVQPVLQAHPEVTHWICGGVNDDSAVAALKGIEEQGKIPPENVLICGLGGYSLAIEEFEKENANFMTVVLDPYKEGYTAMQLLYENITEGKEMPENTFVNGQVATLENWQELIDK